MGVGVRRSEMEIMGDILRIDRGRIAELRLSVNLNHSQLQKYLACLERWDLIDVERSTQLTSFRVTDKGRRVLQLLDKLFEILEADCPDPPMAREKSLVLPFAKPDPGQNPRL